MILLSIYIRIQKRRIKKTLNMDINPILQINNYA